LSSSKKSDCPDVFNPAELAIAIVEALLSIQETDILSTAGQYYVRRHIRGIAIVVHSLHIN
jgi:hypothetical protein